MTPAYKAKLKLSTWKIHIRAKKIVGLLLKAYSIISTIFSFQNNFKKTWFLKKIFLLANTSIEIVLKILFLSLSNADLWFTKSSKFTKGFYTTIKILFIISKIEIIDKKKFV